jgi:hypothetical protein
MEVREETLLRPEIMSRNVMCYQKIVLSDRDILSLLFYEMFQGNDEREGEIKINLNPE